VTELTHAYETQWEVPAVREVVMSYVSYHQLVVVDSFQGLSNLRFLLPTTVVLRE
jgi:hypothetical protein